MVIQYIHHVTAHLCRCLSTATGPGVTWLHLHGGDREGLRRELACLGWRVCVCIVGLGILRVYGLGSRFQVLGSRMHGGDGEGLRRELAWYGIWGLRCGAWNLNFRVWGLGSRFQVLGSRIQGLGGPEFGVWGPGFRVGGPGFRV